MRALSSLLLSHLLVGTLAGRIGDFINSSREGIAALKSDQTELVGDVVARIPVSLTGKETTRTLLSQIGESL